MKIQRKIQLTAATVIGSGALAFSLMSAAPALATTCSPQYVCVSERMCPTESYDVFACGHAAPGCTPLDWTCLPDACGAGQQYLYCEYQ